MKMKKISLAIAASSMFASGVHASALDDLSIHGFGTIGATYMDHKEDRGHGAPDMLGLPEIKNTFGIKDGIDEGYSFKEDTKVGAQANYRFNDSLNFAAQAKVEAINEEYKASLAWLYGSYSVNDALTIRAGRLSTPVFLKSDTIDVGFTYPWVRTPVGLHSMVVTKSFEGVDVLYSANISGQSVDFQAWGGTVMEQDFNFMGNPATVEAEKTYGLSATLPFDYGYVRAVHGVATGLDVQADDLGSENDRLKDLEGTFTAIGGQFNYEDLTVLGEVALREGPSEGGVSEQEAFYVTTGYQVTPVIQPHVTYSRINDKSSGGDQTTITAGVRYDVYPGVAIKAEYSRVKADGYQGNFDASGLGGLIANGGLYGTSPSNLSAESDIASLAIDFVF